MHVCGGGGTHTHGIIVVYVFLYSTLVQGVLIANASR